MIGADTTTDEAIAKAKFWWNAAEVQQVFPSQESTRLFLDWMQRHNLGRKRILQHTTCRLPWTAGVRHVVTANPADFQIFGSHLLVAWRQEWERRAVPHGFLNR